MGLGKTLYGTPHEMTFIDEGPSADRKLYIDYKMGDEITYLLHGCTVEVWECISNLIPQLIGSMITFLGWD